MIGPDGDGDSSGDDAAPPAAAAPAPAVPSTLIADGSKPEDASVTKAASAEAAPADPLQAFIASLDNEAQQEKQVADDEGSFLSQAPPDDTFIERAREFDDRPKHYVRRKFWLPEATKLRDAKGSGLSLLTLPGRHALEVGLYHRNNLLEVSEGVVGVVGFETSPETFGLLQTNEPRFRRLFHADLIETLADPQRSEYDELLSLFPFDIINLDLTGNLVAPKEGPYGPVLKAIRECLRQQARKTMWMLLLTFRSRTGETDAGAVEELMNLYEENLSTHPTVKAACHSVHRFASAKEFLRDKPEEALVQFAAKWITEQAHQLHWKLEAVRSLFYQRDVRQPYVIRKLLFRFSRAAAIPAYTFVKGSIPNTPQHLTDIEAAVRCAPTDIDGALIALSKAKPSLVAEWDAELDDLRRASDGARALDP